MFSGYIPFDEIIQAVKDETGITSLTPFYDKIRRFIFDIEKDIGFGGSVIRKRAYYSIENGTFTGTKFKLPEDFMFFEGISLENNNDYLDERFYTLNTRWLFLKEKINNYIYLTYFGSVCDGEGNPIVTANHKDAIVAGIVYKLYKPSFFKGSYNSAFNKRMLFKDEYTDALLAARGDDAMVNNYKEHNIAGQLLKMSSLDALLIDYPIDAIDYDNPPDCAIETIPTESNDQTMVYHWQYNDINSDITNVQNLSLSDLILYDNENISEYAIAKALAFTNVGRIAFAITNTTENKYKIFDTLNNDITDLVFDKYYNTVENIQFYVSKEIYINMNIIFKITE